MKTKVVSVRSESCDVYIGRAMGKWAGSPFANPFKVGRDGTRAQCIERYREYLLGKPELLALLPQLKGKTLGCWCKPQDCHGDVIVEILEGSEPAQSPPPAAQACLFD